VKPLTDFYRASSNLDGRQYRCKACTAEYKRQNRVAYRETDRETERQRYAANPEPRRVSGYRYREANREAISERKRQYREANWDTISEHKRQYNEDIRDAVLAHYSPYAPPRCMCCKNREDLTIDHVNGDGGVRRRELFGSDSTNGCGMFYRWLIKQGFPADPPLQVLCRSCNSSKQQAGDCRLVHA
jgi:hypothetical protein